jgi:hypothetical protein
MSNWDWGIGEDVPPDPRRALPVFATLPNWDAGIIETLTWLTDVLVSETQVEQRRALRRYPRRTFEQGFTRTNGRRSRIDLFLTGVGQNDCMVPLFHEQFKLGEPTDDLSVLFPAGTLKYREFRENDLVLVTNGDPADFDVLSVQTLNVATDTMTLVPKAPTKPWPAGTRLIPLRRAKILDMPTMNNVTNAVGQVQIKWTLQDADANFLPDWWYCVPLWKIKPDRASTVDMDYQRSTFLLDSQAGVVAVTDLANRAQTGIKIALSLFSRQQVYQLRGFMAAARGRQVRFYMPTFQNDIVPNGDIDGLMFNAQPNGLAEYLVTPQSSRQMIAITFADGRPPVYRTIVDVTAIFSLVAPFRQTAERITLDVPLGPIAKNEINTISFVVPSRFDQDGFELQHVTAGSNRVTIPLITRAVNPDGMPPIECSTTSRPYPVVETEGVRGRAMISGGQLYDPRIFDHLSGVAAITGGTLSGTVESLDDGIESMQSVGAEITGGDLHKTLSAYDDGIESMQSVGADLTGGELNTILIKYTIAPEGMDSAALITGGTLA